MTFEKSIVKVNWHLIINKGSGLIRIFISFVFTTVEFR